MKNIRTVLLTATALCSISGAAMAGTLQFKGIDAPTEDADKRQVRVSTSVTIDGKEYPLAWHTMARAGQKIGEKEFGVLTDAKGTPLYNIDGTPAVQDSADFTSILPVGSKLFSITHFESRPAAMYISELKQDADGNMTPISTRPVDFSSVGGLWVPCAGSVTPWNTHLGSEEYSPNADEVERARTYGQLDDYMLPMARYFGVDTATAPISAFKDVFKPYNYGYPVEVKVTNENGDTDVTKHYAMGRGAVELAYVMPDLKTAYITDDGTNTGLYRFVADKEGDLSAGQLYAAQWNQTSDEGAGAADIKWIDLGHATDAELEVAINLGAKFSDIFDSERFDDDGNCPEGFLPSNAEGRSECLKVKPGMEKLASRLETRRYASMHGATTEFRKMEGLAFDPDGKRLFLAMSEVERGMEDNIKDGKYDLGGRNAVKVAANPCGAVYEMPFGDDYVVTSMKSFVEGKPHEYTDGPYAGQTCDIDGVANPDNLTFIPGYNTLIIAEDTGSGHQNDATWAVNTETKEMTRITTTPYGSENTSTDWFANVNGHAYLTTVVQHPYGESDEDKLENPEDARAYVGYIGPFPVLENTN
ncbi:PhoX family phosphatase [Rhizobium sp. L1K21]|uniref:PhoX family protein n=1 Tax=Rhizobium sp. L1K21 TaxID=2954933 RepID=UPI0020925CB1|nr:alkaline phosphatase PhoX [Rhizobium sp. L1K21]MCO6185120.1 DUF839 domain-containing protein [Rhizobium sp. L1K21]